LRTFEYDAAQRLAKVKVFKSGEAASVSYEYNAFGQRVFKSEYEAEQKLPRRTDLGPGFINWLKAGFGWLYADARRDASIGTVIKAMNSRRVELACLTIRLQGMTCPHPALPTPGKITAVSAINLAYAVSS